ncbi:GNAT family N-acetyltransferase [Paenibacillus sp. GCM10027627]|uniref:GNAT family N-acetyltransferase n=1 Tax=unclassified Paenibacillus TaxID=185978 RepID=UPI00363FDC9F
MTAIYEVQYEQKSTLRNLLELYKYDFTEFDPEDVNENGLYEYSYLDHYWTEEGRYPFFIRVEGKLAGFALVRELGVDENDKSIYSIAEFFVMKKYRGAGVGQNAAYEVFSRFHGVWKVAEMEENIPAQLFWRKTIQNYTNGNFEEVREEDWDGPIQMFSVDKKG